MKKLRKILAWKEVFPEDDQAYEEAMNDYLSKRFVFQEKFEKRHQRKIPLRPKNIWILHAGRLSKEMGSLAHLDTQFGEQKNSQLKLFGQRSCQTKNVLLTVSQREKQFMAMAKREKNPLWNLIGLVPFENCSEDTQRAIKSAITNENNYHFFSKLILFNSVFCGGFECGVFYGHPRVPHFGTIVIVAEHRLSKQAYFVVQKSATTIVEHLDLVKISQTESFFLLMPSEIVLGKPVNIYKLKDHCGNDSFYTASFF